MSQSQRQRHGMSLDLIKGLTGAAVGVIAVLFARNLHTTSSKNKQQPEIATARLETPAIQQETQA